MGQHAFDGNLNGDNFLDFLQHDCPGILDGLNPHLRQKLIYQQTTLNLRNTIVAAEGIVRQKLLFKVTVRAMRKKTRICI